MIARPPMANIGSTPNRSPIVTCAHTRTHTKPWSTTVPCTDWLSVRGGCLHADTFAHNNSGVACQDTSWRAVVAGPLQCPACCLALAANVCCRQPPPPNPDYTPPTSRAPRTAAKHTQALQPTKPCEKYWPTDIPCHA
jgi:hypothetical protein